MPDVTAILNKLRIENYDRELFSMPRTELRRIFNFANGNLHTSRLIRNLIWQDHGKIMRGELTPIHGNIRSYWYTRVKPVLARARAKKYAHKYDMMINQFHDMAVRNGLFSYADFGFTDEGAHNRTIGSGNHHIFCISEKIGHLPLLLELARDYGVTIIAMGGQPSALSSEYFVNELRKSGFDLTAATPVLTIVDFDPAGYSIATSLLNQLKDLGFQGELKRIDLVLPSRMTSAQIKLNKYPLSKSRREKKKNQKWLAITGGVEGRLYGLEADAMSWEELTETFDQEVAPFLKTPREQVVRRRLKQELVDVMKELLLVRLGVG